MTCKQENFLEAEDTCKNEQQYLNFRGLKSLNTSGAS